MFEINIMVFFYAVKGFSLGNSEDPHKMQNTTLFAVRENYVTILLVWENSSDSIKWVDGLNNYMLRFCSYI